MVEMNILSKPMPKRRRAAGGQDSEESVASLAMYIVALVGLIFQVVAIAIGLFYLLDNRSSSQTFDVGLEGILWVGGFIVYASEGINLVFPLMAAMKNPDKFLGCPSLLCAGMITLAAFAVVLVMAGSYSTYNVVFFIFLGTPTSTLGQAVKICAAAGIFCTYPIQLNVAYHFIVLTILFALMSPPHIQYFMGVIGSLCLSFLTFIMPGLIPFCTKNYGKAYWMAVVAVLAFVRGAMLLLSWLNISLKWTQADFSNYQTYC
uniref:Amino acid transporter transmembrane domain-containing protein n=1 Tax=Glossina brevipalpis TaxID=37001 RepID=A0A1A9W0Y4_9MUSC